jgi:hypothetical protein
MCVFNNHLHCWVVLALITFEKDTIDEDSHSEDDSLLIRRRIFGEINNKGISVGKKFLIVTSKCTS